MLRNWQTLHFMDKLPERIRELRISSGVVVTILVICLMSSMYVLSMTDTFKLHFFEPFGHSAPLKKNAQNIVTEEVAKNDIASVTVGRQHSSKLPSTTSSMPTKQNPPILDELLASGFDSESCLSRHQEASYRKTRHHKPSGYLISRLRMYEELHARCGPHSVSYRQTIEELSRSNFVNETTPCKYLVWTPSDGLGNRMISIASAFLYALLNNRVFLVQFEPDMDGLFCEPFPNSSWLLPHNFPHRNSLWSDLPNFNNSRVDTGYHGFSPPFVRLDLRYLTGNSNLWSFHCDKTQSVLKNIPAIILLSNQYFVPSLFMMTSFKEELNKMFPEKATVFHHLGHYLFHPSNVAWGLITRFYKAYLSKADEIIGLQIRIWVSHEHAPKIQSKTIMSQILSCTLKHNILPSLNTNKSMNLSGNQTSKSKALLVVSLHPEFGEELRTMYWTSPTMTGDVIAVYQPSHEEYQKFKDNMHNMKALAEMYLLSLCDVLITSPQSTFGYVGQSLGALNPWIMGSLGNREASDLQCKQDISMEPCFHIPPKYDCNGRKIGKNFSILSSHLMPCQDALWLHGVKLRDA